MGWLVSFFHQIVVHVYILTKFVVMFNPYMGHLKYPYLTLRSTSMQQTYHSILYHKYARDSSLLHLLNLSNYTLHPHNFSMDTLDLSKREIRNGNWEEIIKSYIQCTWIIAPLLLNLHYYCSAYLIFSDTLIRPPRWTKL